MNSSTDALDENRARSRFLTLRAIESHHYFEFNDRKAVHAALANICEGSS